MMGNEQGEEEIPVDEAWIVPTHVSPSCNAFYKSHPHFHWLSVDDPMQATRFRSPEEAREALDRAVSGEYELLVWPLSDVLLRDVLGINVLKCYGEKS